MMDEKNSGGPAFPGVDYVAQNGKVNPQGMALRDYFAAKAMQGFIVGAHDPAEDFIAKVAYAIADAMLAERAK